MKTSNMASTSKYRAAIKSSSGNHPLLIKSQDQTRENSTEKKYSK
jgi:hypothetical protein